MLGIISLKDHIHTFCVSNVINTTNPKEHKNLDSWLLPRLWPGLWKKHPAMIFSQSNNVNKWFSLISHFFFKIKKIQEIVFFSFCLCVIHSFWSSFARCLIWLVFLVQLANSSRAINWGAIFSAVSWSKSLPLTVLGSCNILECDSKVFSQPNLLFCCCLLAASTQWGLLTVFAQIGKKWISRQCNSSFLWPFVSALWSVPP